MRCEYCGAVIQPEDLFISDEHFFCCSLHERWWRGRNDRRTARAAGTDVREVPDLIEPLAWHRPAKFAAYALSLLIIFAVGMKLGSGLLRTRDSIDKTLVQTASGLNKSCPMIVDRETRLDNAVAGVGETFTYNYTLVNHTIGDLNVSDLKSTMKPRIIDVVKTNEAMKYFRDHHVTLVYNYSDKDGVFVMEIKVTPADYQ